MLNYLKVNNFALIENAEVEFSGGFTVVTGESGAGKSICSVRWNCSPVPEPTTAVSDPGANNTRFAENLPFPPP
jgi:putative ribosome biogenesis GTPase RsgA